MNDRIYRKALALANELVNDDPPINTPDGQLLDVVSNSIEQYEREHYQFIEPSPGDLAAFRRAVMRGE